MSKTMEEKIKDLEDDVSTFEKNTLEYKGAFNGDCNDLKTTGIYYTNSGTADNLPSTLTNYVTIICIYINSYMCWQFACKNAYDFYMRKLGGSGPSWTDWYYYSGTIVS